MRTIKEKVFRTLAPPPIEGGLPVQIGTKGNAAVVERVSKVKFGFMAMAIRQEFEVIFVDGKPLIQKITIMKAGDALEAIGRRDGSGDAHQRTAPSRARERGA